MKTRETREKVVQKFIVVTELICDICQKECPNPNSGDWADESFFTDTTYLDYRHYCDGDCDTESIDICPECFEWIQKHLKEIKKLQTEIE